MKLLAIGARIGEIELGCGGCLLLQSKESAQVFNYILSDDGVNSKKKSSCDREHYLGEIKALSASLNIQNFWIDSLTYEDFQSLGNIVNRIKFFIEMISPDIILSPSLRDQDFQRRRVAECIVEAAGPDHNILSYEVTETRGFCPQIYCDISNTFADKLRICDRLFVQEPRHESLNWIRSISQLRALEMGKGSAAESLEIVSYHFSNNFKPENMALRFKHGDVVGREKSMIISYQNQLRKNATNSSMKGTW